MKDQPIFEKAIFAAGCFWGVEHFFQGVKGVKATAVGYTGGHADNPTYSTVCAGNTGHVEAVELLFHPMETSFETLAKLFFEMHNPTLITANSGKRSQYRSAIFYCSEEQKSVAGKLIQKLKDQNLAVQTALQPAGVFYKAEDRHQGYYKRQGKTGQGRRCTPRF